MTSVTRFSVNDEAEITNAKINASNHMAPLHARGGWRSQRQPAAGHQTLASVKAAVIIQHVTKHHVTVFLISRDATFCCPMKKPRLTSNEKAKPRGGSTEEHTNHQSCKHG
jgi:hypothetical protein